MTRSTETDPSLDVAALADYLGRQGLATAGPLSAQFISGGRSNLTYFVNDGSSSWVLRRPPNGDIASGAHDVGREYRVMSALARTAVPVPGTVLLCHDPGVLGAPFYLMDRIHGEVLRTNEQVAAVDVPVRTRLGRALVDTLVDLHNVDFTAVGLASLGRPTGYLERQVERWARQYSAVQIRALPHIDDVLAALRAHLPESPPPSIVHGDYRLDNVITSAGDTGVIAGVLDWEMATLGDPLADLGMLLMFWDEPGRPANPITGGLTAAAGFPNRAEVIERYVARRSLQVDDIDWYLIFCQYKLAVILEQIHARYVAGHTVGDGFENVGDMVGVLLDTAMEQISSSSSLR
jgi:aminoglycoside phosphotransferase (APT) family kinase protein